MHVSILQVLVDITYNLASPLLFLCWKSEEKLSLKYLFIHRYKLYEHITHTDLDTRYLRYLEVTQNELSCPLIIWSSQERDSQKFKSSHGQHTGRGQKAQGPNKTGEEE